MTRFPQIAMPVGAAKSTVQENVVGPNDDGDDEDDDDDRDGDVYGTLLVAPEGS